MSNREHEGIFRMRPPEGVFQDGERWRLRWYCGLFLAPVAVLRGTIPDSPDVLEEPEDSDAREPS